MVVQWTESVVKLYYFDSILLPFPFRYLSAVMSEM